MLVHQVAGAWVLWDFQPVGGNVFQRNIEALWSDDELSKWGFRRVTPFKVPDGKVPTGKARYVDQQGGAVSETFDVIDAPTPPSRTVLKSVIIDRLQVAGALEKASQVINADLYARERWYSPDKPSVSVDNKDVLGILALIGVDPAVILAP